MLIFNWLYSLLFRNKTKKLAIGNYYLTKEGCFVRIVERVKTPHVVFVLYGHSYWASNDWIYFEDELFELNKRDLKRYWPRIIKDTL